MAEKCGPLFLEEGDSYYLDLAVLFNGSPFVRKVGQVPMVKEQFDPFWLSARHVSSRFNFEVTDDSADFSDKNTQNDSAGSSTSLEKANSQKTMAGPGAFSGSKLSSAGQLKPGRPSKSTWSRSSSKVLPIVGHRGSLSVTAYLISKKATQMTAYLVEYLKLLRLIFGSHVEDKLDGLKSVGLTQDFLLMAVEMPLPTSLRKQFYKILMEGLFLNSSTLLDLPVIHLE